MNTFGTKIHAVIYLNSDISPVSWGKILSFSEFECTYIDEILNVYCVCSTNQGSEVVQIPGWILERKYI